MNNYANLLNYIPRNDFFCVFCQQNVQKRKFKFQKTMNQLPYIFHVGVDECAVDNLNLTVVL